MHRLTRVRQFLTRWTPAALTAGLAGVGGLAGSYAVAGFTPSFVAGPIAGLLARNMPGAVLSFAIVVLGDLGHQLNLLSALGIAVGLLATAGLVGRTIGHRFADRATDGRLDGTTAVHTAAATAIAAVLAGCTSLAITGAAPASAGAGLGVAVVLAVADLAATTPTTRVSETRRELLGGLAAGVATAAGGFTLGRRATEPVSESIESADADRSIDSLLTEADEKSLDVDGLEPLISENFYTVDINATDPVVEPESWTLSVTGAVDEQIEYSLADLQKLETENRVVSLRCVGENLNGKKLDNAVWTGVPMQSVIEPAGVPDNCCVMLRAADGFFEEFPLSALRDSLLAYGMNGESLPRQHGFPARALVPGRWGEVNVKWLTEIEILTEPEDGYWENRGWKGTGPVNTVAKLRAQNRLDDGRVEVAGRAYAGTRGIDRVEVSTDGGATWTDATLSDPLPSEDALRQWVHRYEPPDGTHEVVVRATDGTGTLQPEESSQAFPSGPTGWVSVEIDPDAL